MNKTENNQKEKAHFLPRFVKKITRGLNLSASAQENHFQYKIKFLAKCPGLDSIQRHVKNNSLYSFRMNI